MNERDAAVSDAERMIATGGQIAYMTARSLIKALRDAESCGRLQRPAVKLKMRRTA